MKIGLGGGQFAQRAELRGGCVASHVRLMLHDPEHLRFYAVCIAPETARALFGALRDFDNAGLLEDEL